MLIYLDDTQTVARVFVYKRSDTGRLACSAVAVQQQGAPPHAAKLSLPDGLLDFTRPAAEAYARWRGVTSEPGAHTTIDGERLKIIDAALTDDGADLAAGEMRGTKQGVLIGTPDGALEVRRVQPAGKGAMAAADWWRGLRADTSPKAGS